MKTFDEALKCLQVSPRRDLSQRAENLISFRDEALASQNCRDFLTVLTENFVCELDSRRINGSDLLHLALAAFAAGVTVGVEMEKEEIEPARVKRR